jgi:two-component system CheB/CheR fusion protein
MAWPSDPDVAMRGDERGSRGARRLPGQAESELARALTALRALRRRATAATALAARERAERIQLEKALATSQDRNRSLFSRMTEGFVLFEIVCDRAGRPADLRYLDVNPAFEQLTGLSSAEVMGRLESELLGAGRPGDSQHTHWVQVFGEVALTGRPAQLEWVSHSRGRHCDLFAFCPAPSQVAVLLVDSTERAEFERELWRRQEAFRALADNSPDCVDRVDQEGRHLYMNAAGAALLGRTPEQVVGRTTRDLGEPEPWVSTWEERIRRVFATGRPLDFEDSFRTSSGIRFLHSRCVAERAPDGEVASVLVISRDITERREAEDALRDADRRKNEFLAMLSHELRNPLTPIRNSLFILDRAEPGGDVARRAKSVMDRQVTHLARLVDDLLDLTRISRGKIQLQRQDLELAELLRRTLEDHRSELTRRGLGCQLRVAADPLWVNGDPARLAQAIGNLLQNASKFTGPGGHVTVDLDRDPVDGQAVLRIRDDGVGIEPDLLPRLFRPFEQADRTLDRSRGGLGLGLALVKVLVELHGGTVWARSDGLGAGSEFTIRLPTQRRALDPVVLEAPRVPARRVLVIEDNTDAADSLREALALSGHVVEVAYDGADGLAKTRAFKPEMILCDIGLPGMDGYQVARSIRSDPSLRSTFLVALTGYAMPADVALALEAGFDRHLAKPPTLEALEQVLGGPPGLEEVRHA